jgi:uncharacterized protein (DUF305 family)
MWKRLALSASIAALIAGCGGANDDQAQSHNSAEDHAQESAPSGPFGEIEMDMHERMMAANGANASETWARKMIEHHRGAIAMSQLLIDQGGDPQMVQMARQTVEKQQREIAELERVVQSGIRSGSGEPNPFGPVEQQMHQSMMAANGANLSETWARKMIVHHQGAVDMSELLLRQGDGDETVLAMARRTAADQRREIAHLEAMLRGESMPAEAAPAGSATKAAPAPVKARETEAPAARQPSTAPKATPSPPPPPKAEASPAPKDACTPEHAAMGHC